jgi:Fe-S oxidoreductase
MAKLKHELLSQRYEQYGMPLRARLFSHIALLSRFGSATAPLSNALARAWPARLLLHCLLGIHRQRPLPWFQRDTFRRWFKQRQSSASEAPRGEAILLDDTFTRFHYPQVGRAATQVLEALGYRVVVVQGSGCCGRPAISNGMLNMAHEQARRNVLSLLHYAERGVPIIGVEPSCLLTLRDEYPDLLSEEPLRTASRTVADQVLLLDELLAQLATESHSIGSIFRSDAHAQIVLHGHCHQKALADMESTLTALALVPGYSTTLVNSPCCGMAGSFGFKTEHYQFSYAMGALKLFPAVEAASEEATIAITGASCRQQIDHFTSRTARHVVELFAEALR